MMKKIRIGLIIVAVALIIVNLFYIDYSNFNWSENSNQYGQILAFCILIAGLIYSIRYDKKHK